MFKLRLRVLAEMTALMLAPTAAIGQDQPVGYVILENRGASDAALYLDGQFACSAPAHGRCTAQVPTGVHVAMIEFGDGDQLPGGVFDLAADVPVILPVVDLLT